MKKSKLFQLKSSNVRNEDRSEYAAPQPQGSLRWSATEAALDQIRAIPVIDVAVKLNIQRKGRKAFCFDGHDVKTPSLSFEPYRNRWKCFGCGKHGDNIQLVMEVLSCGFAEALNWFSDEFGISITGRTRGRRKPRPRPNHTIRKREEHLPLATDSPNLAPDGEVYSWFLRECRLVKAEIGTKYLQDHGISRMMAERFSVRELTDPDRICRALTQKWGVDRVVRSGIAWSVRNGSELKLIWNSYTLVFPFFQREDVIYLQGRLFVGDNKYVSPHGISKPLFHEERLRALPKGSIVHICEGVPDVITMEGRGFPAVGVLGASSFRSEWVDKFGKFEVFLMRDGDTGGNVFARTVSKCFQERGKSVRVIRAPEGLDVADVMAQGMSADARESHGRISR